MLNRRRDGGARFIEKFADDRALFLAERFHPIRPGGDAAGTAEVADTRGFERLLVGRCGDLGQRGIAQLFQLVRHGKVTLLKRLQSYNIVLRCNE